MFSQQEMEIFIKMCSVLCVLLLVNLNVFRVVIELGEFIMLGPVRNACGGQGTGRWEVDAGGSVSLLAGLTG